MKMFSNCSGPCETCKTHYTGGCLAGHGDDEYVRADPDWIKQHVRESLALVETKMGISKAFKRLVTPPTELEVATAMAATETDTVRRLAFQNDMLVAEVERLGGRVPRKTMDFLMSFIDKIESE